MTPSLHDEVHSKQMFLLFRVQGELYGTPLSGVREVVPYQSPKPVPNTKKFYLGIVNIRGDVAGVVDMRFWFQDIKPATGHSHARAMIVADSSAGLMAVSVDGIESICPLDSRDIEYAKSIPSSFSAGGMIGIGRFKQGLATLLDLRALFNHLDVVDERKERWAS